MLSLLDVKNLISPSVHHTFQCIGHIFVDLFELVTDNSLDGNVFVAILFITIVFHLKRSLRQETSLVN